MLTSYNGIHNRNDTPTPQGTLSPPPQNTLSLTTEGDNIVRFPLGLVWYYVIRQAEQYRSMLAMILRGAVANVQQSIFLRAARSTTSRRLGKVAVRKPAIRPHHHPERHIRV